MLNYIKFISNQSENLTLIALSVRIRAKSRVFFDNQAKSRFRVRNKSKHTGPRAANLGSSEVHHRLPNIMICWWT